MIKLNNKIVEVLNNYNDIVNVRLLKGYKEVFNDSELMDYFYSETVYNTGFDINLAIDNNLLNNINELVLKHLQNNVNEDIKENWLSVGLNGNDIQFNTEEDNKSCIYSFLLEINGKPMKSEDLRKIFKEANY